MAEEIIDKETVEVLPVDELEVGTVSIIPMQDAFVHNSDNMVMCTFDTDGSKASKLRLHKIKANPDERLQDHINEKITVTGFVAHWVETKNERTGEITPAPRIILIDDKGTTYTCVSIGVYNSLRNIVMDLWLPSEEEPIVIIPRRVKGKNRYEFTSLEVSE